ncbi:MAG: chorismate synthase, partial [Clostridia bacterium]|nr:chorismate synthase [Clostridia bacterium]
MSNQLGERYRLTVFGQSHAPAIGGVIEGLPAGVAPDMDFIRAFMARRAPGNGPMATARKEADAPEIIAGLNEWGRTCGAPLAFVIQNGDHHSRDYADLRDVPRPGHADYPAAVKFGGENDIRGGGQFSGRLTAPLCFAGALTLQLLKERGIRVKARVHSIAGIPDGPMDMARPDLDAIADGPLPCVDPDAAARMADA